MGLLDPIYAGVNSVIAGAGSVAGGAVSSGTTPHVFDHEFYLLFLLSCLSISLSLSIRISLLSPVV